MQTTKPRTHAQLADTLSYLTNLTPGQWVSYNLDDHTHAIHDHLPFADGKLRSSVEYHPDRRDNVRTLIRALVDAALSATDNSGTVIAINHFTSMNCVILWVRR